MHVFYFCYIKIQRVAPLSNGISFRLMLLHRIVLSPFPPYRFSQSEQFSDGHIEILCLSFFLIKNPGLLRNMLDFSHDEILACRFSCHSWLWCTLKKALPWYFNMSKYMKGYSNCKKKGHSTVSMRAEPSESRSTPPNLPNPTQLNSRRTQRYRSSLMRFWMSAIYPPPPHLSFRFHSCLCPLGLELS